jgi:hypothetical protein
MSAEAARFAVGLFYSGIFWMMVLFLVEVRTMHRRVGSFLVVLAVALMIVSAYLMLGVVAHQELFAMPLNAA